MILGTSRLVVAGGWWLSFVVVVVVVAHVGGTMWRGRSISRAQIEFVSPSYPTSVLIRPHPSRPQRCSRETAVPVVLSRMPCHSRDTRR